MGLEDSRQERWGQERSGRVLRQGGEELFTARSRPVSGPLADVVDGLWSVRWQRPGGMPHRQQVLSDPVVHLTVEESGPADASGRTPDLHGQPMPAVLVHGPVTELFEVDLPPQGWTTGARFHPGGLAALLDVDASTLRDRVLRAAPPLLPGHAGVDELRRQVLTAPTDEERWDLLEGWLTELHAEVTERIAGDTAYRAVRRAVELMKAREQVQLEPVAEAVHCSVRTLQRWFDRYVGVSPLRVLRRHRLQDVTAALDAGVTDLAGLAADLGFADQAHLTREFTATVGVPPSAYRRRGRAAEDVRQSTPGRDR